MNNFDNISLEELKDLLEVVNCLLDYSGAAIIRNNFIEAFYNNTIDGYLHGSYSLFGAKSFRLTSSQPNLLNTPSTGSVYSKPVKDCFEAKEGKIFYHVDFNSLEDVVIANLSKDKNKCSIYLNGLDSHCLNSYYYFKEQIEEILPRKKDESTEDYIKRYKKEVGNNDKLKAIRQKSKACTFGLSYGAYPPKIAKSIKCSLEEATEIFNRYHNELYPDLDVMKNKVIDTVTNKGKIHLGLGCYLHSSDADKEARTLNNACSQFWSILTLLTINKLNKLIEKDNLTSRVVVCSTIYDSIYLHIDKDSTIIKWVNDHIIPLMTNNFLKDTVVKNRAIGDISYTWNEGIEISNNATIEEIEDALRRLDDEYKVC